MKMSAGIVSIILVVSAATFISGCLKVDTQKAKSLIENLLNDRKNENYSKLDDYYISSFNESEPLEQKIEKFRQLKETMGAIQSFEFISSKEIFDDQKNINEMQFIYKVKYARIPAKETYLVINDEGKEKIVLQNVENWKE